MKKIINNKVLFEIAAKAEYISDVARAVAAGKDVGVVVAGLAQNVLKDLEAIADTIDEWAQWEEE